VMISPLRARSNTSAVLLRSSRAATWLMMQV
jgi:hypothetical protein